MLDALQTRIGQLIDRFGGLESSKYPLLDVSPLHIIVSRRGRKRIVTEEEAKAYCAAHPARIARPPRVQAVMAQALAWQAELDGCPGLTRAEFAQRKGVDPSRVTKILSLLALAPEIQQHVLAMPPSVRRGPITERRLRRLAWIRERDGQLQEFQRIVGQNGI